MIRRLGRLYSIGVVLLAWEILARSGLVNPRLFPTLGVIGEELALLFTSGAVWQHIGATMFRVSAGFAAAAVVGVLLGVVMARLPLAGRLVEPFFSMTYPVPRVAIYPIFVLAFGLGHLSKVSLVFLECLYPITIATYLGTRAVDRSYIWAAQNVAASPRDVLTKVVLPAAAPYIFAGLRIALPIALVIAVITEMVGATEGMGYLIAYAAASLSRAQVFAGVVVIAAFGFALDVAITRLRDRLVFWERKEIAFG